MRILGLDVGTKRIGLAISDELLLTAQGAKVIQRKDPSSDMNEIQDFINENGVAEVVVGLPVNMNGTIGPKAKETTEFIDGLSKVVNVPVKTWDERLSTAQAERTLLEADMSRARRKKVMDKVAAQVILQSYLDFRRKGKPDA